MNVRPARPDERAALEDLQRRSSLSQEAYREALLANPEAIELPLEHVSGGNCFVAERDGVVIAFAVVLPQPDGGAELDGLFVEPDMFGRGAGRLLVEAACGRAREWGAPAMFVVANPHARGFYEACGFRLTGEAATQFGPALSMRRDIV